MVRIVVVTAILLLAASSPSAGHSACSHLKFGSQAWWKCVSSQGGFF